VVDKDHFEIIRELLDLKASLKDKELNSDLLHNLIRKYVITEKRLKTAYKELSEKNIQIIEALEARDHAYNRLEIEQKRTKELADLLKKMFGHYLSPQVMNALLEDPASLELGGEKRNVTILMSDLRGFTALCERLKPEQVVLLLNGYCKFMMEVIDKYHGTVNEIIGDSLLIIFGAPEKMSDQTQRAVACAIEMQNAMVRVNHYNQSNGLPELEMGIGMNETEVVVGNIGSDKRSKYSVVGSGVNLTSRIESYSVGGQILVSESVYNKLGSLLNVDSVQEVYPKGSEIPLRIYEISRISGTWNIGLEVESSIKVDLTAPILVECKLIKDKAVKNKVIQGSIVQLSRNEFQMNLPKKLAIFTNLQMNLIKSDSNLSSILFYGKVIRVLDETKFTHNIQFTFAPPEIKSFFKSSC